MSTLRTSGALGEARPWRAYGLDIAATVVLALTVYRAVSTISVRPWWPIAFLFAVLLSQPARHRSPRWHRLWFIGMVGIGAALLLAGARH
jgi:hypothetical protein